MTVYVALLRGINVGKAKRIAMAGLRALLADLGYTQVVTILNSGNAVFSTDAQDSAVLAGRIEQAISQQLRLDVPVVVKSAIEFEHIMAGCARAGMIVKPAQFLVAFVQQPAALAGLTRVRPWLAENEHFTLGESAAYLDCGNGILASKAAEALLGRGRDAITTRNWSTVTRIAGLLRSAH